MVPVIGDSGKTKAQLLQELESLRSRVVEFKLAPAAPTQLRPTAPTDDKPAPDETAKLEHLYRTAPVGLCCLDTSLRYVHINEWLAAINGLTVEEHLGRTIRDVLPDVAAGVEKQMRKVIETGEPVIGGTVEAEIPAQPGQKRTFLHSYYARRSEDNAVIGLSCCVQDITERKRAEEQARQLQADLAHMSRLSSIGEMASGLAHELNQPLTVITNYAQGCVRRLKSNAIGPEELEDILVRIATQARRSSSIIRGLGNLVRKSSALRFEIDINRSIMEVADLANAEAAQYRVKARFELEPNLPLVMADQTQLQQVILNLVQNGCEAIQDTPESRRAVIVRTKQRGDRELEISVSDNGRGISEPLGERLFEPFFTTKAQGIGMGLAISRSIVESHGGRLWATPNQGGGTTFHFTLPIVGGGDGDEQ